MQETLVRFLVREDPLKKEIHWRKDRLPILVFLGFPCGSTGKESARNAGELGSIPGSGRARKESACNAGDLGLTLELGRSPGGGKLQPI